MQPIMPNQWITVLPLIVAGISAALRSDRLARWANVLICLGAIVLIAVISGFLTNGFTADWANNILLVLTCMLAPALSQLWDLYKLLLGAPSPLQGFVRITRPIVHPPTTE
jgi:hypothetical protein